MHRKWYRAAVMLAAGLACGAAAWAVEPGQPAPAFELPGTKGPLVLQKLKGKVVYLDFWASWCGPCRQSFPWMNEMQAKYGPRGLQIVGVNLDAKATDAEKFLADVPAQFTVAYDPKGDTARRYAIKGMPSSVLIGADGKVIKVHAGFREDERRALEDAIVAALAQP
jgi:cytochrome c biogenesis protein CcmG/thiol:disulfide interchange protein DsbE